MRVTASGGTDTANIVLFWPDNLPDDADALLEKDPLALAERLRGEGKLIRFPCCGDGAYSLAIYLDEPLPEELRAVCVDEERYPVVTAQGTPHPHPLSHPLPPNRERGAPTPGGSLATTTLCPKGREGVPPLPGGRERVGEGVRG